jgi:hypothetical protein
MDAKRQSIDKYFTSKFPKWAVVLVVIGVIMGLSGISSTEANMGRLLIGVLLLAGGGFAIFNSTKIASDEQIDEWTREDIKGLVDRRALEKMGTDASELVGESVFITGPRLKNIAPAKFGYRKGKDSNLRFTPVDTAVINFTQDQLLVYRCAMDLITGKPINESTDEYFYRDVVSVQTASDTMSVTLPGFKDPIQMDSAESFKLTTSGGTSVSIVLRDPSLIKKMGGGEIPTTIAEKTIQTIRKMLREKKAVGASV